MSDWSDEETNDPLVADLRNFYKVEKWTRDGMPATVSPGPRRIRTGNQASSAYYIDAPTANKGARSVTGLSSAQNKAPAATRLDPAKYAGLSGGRRARNSNPCAGEQRCHSVARHFDKLLGTREWFVIHHTNCGMELFTDDVIGEFACR